MAQPDYSDPKTILSIAQLLVLIGTVIWVFAFLQADVDHNKVQIQRHQEILDQQEVRQRNTYVRQDVFAEQYRSILEKLERIESKLND